MRNSILTCGLILLAVVDTASAQDPSTFPLTPICTVRIDPEADCRGAANLQVCVEGVVLAWKQFGVSGPGAILGSDGCAISIFDITSAPDLPPGTLVRVCGWSGPFQGLDEIVDDPVDGTPDPVVTVLGTAPVPVTSVTSTDLANNSPTAEGLQSKLVKLVGTITGSFPPAGVGANVSFVDLNGNSCTLRIDNDTNIGGTTAPSGTVAVTGILNQFDAGMNCAGYQLQPRSLADITPIFSEVSVGLPGVSNSSVAWGDYDNDGDLDILLTGVDIVGTLVSKVYRNDGGGTFTDIGAGLVGVRSSSVAWGDFDDDSDLDILLTGLNAVNAPVSKVYLNNGGGTFTDLDPGGPPLLTGVGLGSVAWGDYDNDGDLDILLTGSDGAVPISKLYRRTPFFPFVDVGAGLAGVAYGSVAWGDYDNDGDLDILLTGYTGASAVSKVYRNNGDETFTDVGAGLTGVYTSSVAWGDYDNDGDLDILLTGYDGAADVAKLYRNSGGVNPTFSDVGAGLTGVESSSVAWGDYDNDGDLDILLTGTLGGFAEVSKVYANNGGANPTFSDVGAGLAPVSNSSVAWGDYDNDGDLDILLAGSTQFASASKLYRNGGASTNTPPSAPTGLAAVVGLGADPVTLSWTAANDAQTPSAGLTYNLRVGTTPGGNEVSSAMAAGGGYRRVVRLGNANHNLDWALKLEGGIYYWSVQAMDGAFAGSPFAPEQSFSVIGFTEVREGFLSNVLYSSVAWGDYDNDGDLDILLTGELHNGDPVSKVYFQYGDGGGQFEGIEAGLIDVGQSSVAWGDYDNDGDLDILLTGRDKFSALISKVYRNDGSGTFTDIGASLTGVYQSSVAWGDYDNDGDLDILLTGFDGAAPVSKLYRNDGSGAFTDIGAGLVGVRFSSVAWGDYDNDGDLDILLTGHDGAAPVSKLYRNDGSGAFTDIGASLTSVYGSVAWGDYDNDGDLDILLTGNDGAAPVSKLYRNDGSGVFTDIGASLTSVYGSVAWGDYDNDGDLDILLTGDAGANDSKLYRNDGSGTFTDIEASLIAAQNSAWGDYDNDGDLDILLTGGFRCKLYRNDGPPLNTPPAAPGGLSAVRNGEQLTFSWTAASDDHTPSAGLSYNLRVGTSPDGDQTMPAMAAPSGYRRVVQLGNAQERTSWTLALPPVSYYWSVQALDGAFHGSPFATGTPVVVAVEETPEVSTTFELGPATPNPFAADVALSFALPHEGRVELAVFDPRGRRVRVLTRGERPAGRHWVQWDGRDETGARQPNGIYLVRMMAAGKSWTRKLVLAH